MHFVTLRNARLVELWYLGGVEIRVGSLESAHDYLSLRCIKGGGLQLKVTGRLYSVNFLLSELHPNFRFASIVARFSNTDL